MTFWDHLDELRGCFIRSILVYVVLCAALFCFKSFLFEKIVLAPATDASLDIVNIEITAQFMTHIKVAFIAALIFAVPYFLFEMWRFVAPALYQNEKKSVKRAFGFASLLFYIGLFVGYRVVLPLMVNFFRDYSVSDAIVNKISLSSYMSMFSSTVLLFGLVFELPVLAALLSSFGILTREMLLKGWRYAVIIVVVLAALITPSGDPFSLAVVCLPLFVLYGISIAVCKKGEAGI